MGNNYVPMYIALFLMIVIGCFLPLIISPFVNINNPPNDTILTPTINFFKSWSGLADSINNTSTALGAIAFVGTPFKILFDFLAYLPLSFYNLFFPSFVPMIVSYLSVFAFIPNIMLVPLMMIISASLLYSFIKIFWGN
jgi:hypothetical protein